MRILQKMRAYLRARPVAETANPGYGSVSRGDSMTPPDDLPPDLRAKVLAVNKALEPWGWCTPAKALGMATLIFQVRPKCVVEIGIFGGRSLLPQAVALKHVGSGLLWGVEPWSNAIAIETPTAPENDEWWAKVDLQGAKKACLTAILENDVCGIVKILECRSGEALDILGGGIDIIHVDGNHSGEQALADVTRAFRAVADGGYIWLDDIAWPSVAPALAFLEAGCETIGKYSEGPGGSYGLFRKHGGEPKA